MDAELQTRIGGQVVWDVFSRSRHEGGEMEGRETSVRLLDEQVASRSAGTPETY